LGRLPRALPRGVPVDGARRYSPAAAFGNAVEWALDNEVDAVLLAGDVVDNIHDRFEGLPVLAEGAEKLSEAGIKIVAVAGNHDVEALPRLARLVPDIAVLGADGSWSATEVRGKDGTEIDVLGWSFPRSGGGHFRGNPLETLERRAFDRPTVGLLHADIDTPGGPYAPVRRADLEAVPVSAWLLGHIHKPHDLSSMRRPIGYLGSICGLDPGERGARGAWLANVHKSGAVEMERVPIAPIRWEELDVDAAELAVGATADAASVEDAVVDAVRTGMKRLAGEIAGETGPERAVGCRIRISGRSPAPGAVRDAVERLSVSPDTFDVDVDGVDFFVEGLSASLRPELDVGKLAKGSDAVALLARRILALENGGDEARETLRGFRGKMLGGLQAGLRGSAKDVVEDDAALLERLLEGAYQALDAALSTVAEEGAE